MTDYTEKQKFPNYLLCQLDKCIFCGAELTKTNRGYLLKNCPFRNEHNSSDEIWCYYDEINNREKIVAINIRINQYQFCFSLAQQTTTIYLFDSLSSDRPSIVYRFDHFLDIKFDKDILLKTINTALLLR